MVGGCVFYSDTLGVKFMQIFEDIRVAGKYIVVFSFDEQEKIRIQADRTQRLITGIVLDVMSWGLENYPYTKKECSKTSR